MSTVAETDAQTSKLIAAVFFKLSSRY